MVVKIGTKKLTIHAIFDFYFFSPLVQYILMGCYESETAGVGAGVVRIAHPELMQVYLARHRRRTKSIRSQLGMIKIAICYPFSNIMLSIKHLIHGLGSTRASSLMAHGLLTLASAGGQCWVNRHRSAVLRPPRHPIHYRYTPST